MALGTSIDPQHPSPLAAHMMLQNCTPDPALSYLGAYTDTAWIVGFASRVLAGWAHEYKDSGMDPYTVTRRPTMQSKAPGRLFLLLYKARVVPIHAKNHSVNDVALHHGTNAHAGSRAC
jgi:hypothetical protein